MKTYRTVATILIFILTLTINSCGIIQAGVEDENVETAPSPSIAATFTPEPQPPEVSETTAATSEGDVNRHTFDQLGISMEVPADLYVQKEPIVNLNDPSKLESYLFYIQNYGYPEGPNTGDFQMYGHLQFGIPTESWEQFAAVQNDSTNYEYVNYIEVNGLRGFDAQFSGQRNRFVYMFYLDGHILTIAVAEPTLENKALSDQIVNTLTLTGSGLSDASHVQMIADPQGLYQTFLPEDWTYAFNAPAGIRLSDMEASSPDAEVLVEDQEGPHSNFYYKDGIFMNFVVLDDDSATREPSMATILSKSSLYLYGVEIDDYRFVEPSTAEGEIREFRFYHNEHSYLMRFAFPSGTNQEQIELILTRLQLTDQ